LKGVWSDPAARKLLVEDMAGDLDLGVRLTAANGTVMESVGPVDPCKRKATVAAPDGATLELCSDARHGGPWRAALYVFPVALLLWVISGRYARRIARPLAELTQTARDLGEGKLDRRAKLPRFVLGEVGALAEALNEMAARIERQLRSEKELLAGVSHELRSPLARIRLLIELGREKEASEQTTKDRDVLGEIESETVAIDELVGELLAVARLDFRALSPRPLDGAELARRAAKRAAELHPGAAPVVIEADAAPISGDATLLQRALGILLDNARRHGGGTVKLRVTAHFGRVVFEVQDGGPGFHTDDLPKVFEPFFRGQGEAHDESHGVGLGLAIVRRVAEAHGGTAWAKNLDGGGAAVGFDVRA
jgi:signal transduction histidine kinase